MDRGLIVSEYAPGVEPAPWRFPARNRVIAGLAAATVVVGMAVPLPRFARISVLALGATIAVQYLLGVATLLLVVPVWLASAHQVNSELALKASLVLLHALRRAPSPGSAVPSP